MSTNDLFEKMRERLAKVDPNNRKVVAIFQIKCGDVNFVIDLKDLKVYEGTASDADATITCTDMETFLKLVKKETTMAEAQSEGKVSISGNVELVLKAQSV